MGRSFSVVFEIDKEGIFKDVIQGDPGFDFIANPKDFLGHHFANFLNKEIQNKIKFAQKDIENGKQYSDFSYNLQSSNGQTFYDARLIKNKETNSDTRYFLFVKDATVAEKQKWLLNSILDSSISGIVKFKSIRNNENEIIDFEFEIINSEAEKMLGLKQNEAIGNSLLLKFPGHIATGLFEKYIAVVETGETLTIEHSYQHDNIDGWYKTSAVKLGDGFVVTFDDITSNKSIELKLKESNRLINEISKKNGFVFFQFLMDNEGNTSLPYISDGLEYMTGIPSESVKYSVDAFYEIIHENDVEHYWQSILQSAKTLTPWDHEFRMIKSSDEIRWIKGKSTPSRLENGAIIWHGFLEDITVRKIIEDELLTSKNRLKLALESGDFGIWDIDLVTGELFWDDTLLQLFETSRESFKGSFQDYMNIIHPDSKEISLKTYEAALRGEIDYRLEFKSITGKGNIRWNYSSAQIIYNKKNEPIRMIGITQDITSRKETEERLLLQNERLKEISWIESHVVRSPLSNILGLLPLFDRDEMGNSENIDFLNKLEKATKKLDEVINEVVQKASEIYEINKKDK